MSFISVFLSKRGIEKGRDSYPVFHVNPYSTVVHTIAKLVATKSYCMWVVESAYLSPSAPATPLLASIMLRGQFRIRAGRRSPLFRRQFCRASIYLAA
jgi:hypothetical protein